MCTAAAMSDIDRIARYDNHNLIALRRLVAGGGRQAAERLTTMIEHD